METNSMARPLPARHHSKVPGGFETDDEHSPIKPTFEEIASFDDTRPSSSGFKISGDNASSPQPHHDEENGGFHDESSVALDKEMNRQLQDIESSFIPDPSPLAREQDRTSEPSAFRPDASFTPDLGSTSQTPQSSYKTPAVTKDNSDLNHHESDDRMNTSTLETLSSSPTANAAARTVSRVVSMASLEGYETAAEGPGAEDSAKEGQMEEEPTPTKDRVDVGNAEDNLLTPRMSPSREYRPKSMADSSQGSLKTSRGSRRRPKYLSSRHASQRSSYSSNTTSTSAEGSSDLPTGAEYALQTGGGTPLGSSSTGRPDEGLSRSISLGSMASSILKFDEDDGPQRGTGSNNVDLDTLQEEGSPQSSVLTTKQDMIKEAEPQTPRASTFTPETLTDTVINQHVKNMEIPGTIARNFLSREGIERSASPDKRSGLPTPAAGRVKNLTLKEQSGLIDKLQKENWKLKLKVYFMDQMLNERSDEAVKAMISENVELKTFKFSATKEIRGQKRSIKELEAKLRERDERLASQNSALHNSMRQSSYGAQSAQASELETEITYLRESIGSYRVDLERLRAENAVKEGEKRRLAEMVRSVGDRSTINSDTESREEVGIWKDLLEAETGRREQTEEENRKLQEELWRLKAEGATTGRFHLAARSDKNSKVSETGSDVNGVSKSSLTLVESLRQENEELRRDLGAQASMLTSRNREKEKLYQEIEELKMGHRQDGRASVGDSIFERSISRAHGRSTSRTSSQSRVTQVGDTEREAYENANGELRDRIAGLKLENQELTDHLDRLLDELESQSKTEKDFDSLKKMYDELTEQTNQEILGMQSERDEALQLQEEAETSFQDLRAEAQERINTLEDELDQNTESIRELEQELAQRDEESKALRNEVRMTSEGLDKVEADVQAKIRRIKELELENEEINRELENIENSLIEANGKSEKLSIEIESRQSECAFLREEQDGFVLKIGDLETALKGAQASLKSEKDRTKDLETRLGEERHQREVVGSKEKQEVQKIINDLNREATSAKDEARGLKKDLETRGIEVGTWKDRLSELEQALRDIVGEKNGSKTNIIFAVSEIQRNLEETIVELTTTKTSLSEKDRILKKRDALLESHGLEARKLSELLEKERSARRADRAQHEQWQKTSQHSSRTISQKESRIVELEQSRQTDRKRMATLEQQFKEQLSDRNKLLLELWNKLSVLCGNDWVNQNNLVNNHLPTVDVISNMLPAFQKNLLLAVKTIESAVGNFPRRIKNVEAALMKDYQQLEHNLDLRIRRLDRLESSIQQGRVSGVANAAPEIAKLRGENRLLKSDLAELQKQAQVRQSRQNAVSIEHANPGSSPGKGSKDNATKAARAAAASSLTRHYSSTTAETIQRDQHNGRPQSDSYVVQSQPIEPSQARWIHRLKDLERRLKAEREARLQDRKGARERLEEGRAEYEELRQELERERERNRLRERDSEPEPLEDK